MEIIGLIAIVVVITTVLLAVIGQVTNNAKKIKEIEHHIKK